MLNMLQLAAREQFDVANGSDGIVINGWVTYSNGAQMENSQYGAMHDPPENPWERAKIQLTYHERLRSNARKQFDEWKQQCIWAASAAEKHGLPGTTPADITRLEALQAEVQRLDINLREAQAQVERHMPPELKAREEQTARNREAGSSALQEIINIRV